MFQVVTCITAVTFSRFSEDRRQARSERGAPAPRPVARVCLSSLASRFPLLSWKTRRNNLGYADYPGSKDVNDYFKRLLSYHSAYSHCVVFFHHFFGKHGGQSNNRRFFRMISLKTKTMSMRKFLLLIPNCYQRASWEKWVVNNLLWGFLALLWSLTGIFIKHCTSINSKNCYSDDQYIRDL